MTGRAKASSIHYQWRYDVFLNFRGEDTRYGFTGNLYEALHKRGVRTFFDDNEIGIGDKIKPTLLEAIKESRMAITVFSEKYASSTFCLNELVQIHQCIMGNGRLVWPIFYDVEPSEVRHQTGKYGEELVKLEQNSRADEDKINSWKHALCEVANLKGSSHDPRKNYEYKLIDEIVNGILRIMKRVPLHVAEYPVGLNSRVEKINSLLQLGSNNEVIMFGICGTGGMGKTTIARAVYNAIADHFDYLCFLNDIKGESGKHGLKQVQASMLSSILEQKMEIEDIYRGVEPIKRVLRDKKILLILDNVDERQQLEMLAGACDWFGLGSRIIITTRDIQLIKRHKVKRIYEMEGLNAEESLELLSWKAFEKTQVDDPTYKDVVQRAISYAAGLPLAIELIGSDLYRKDVNEWESKLDGCKKLPHDMIQQILRESYDGLETLEREVFLDIACFYKGGGLNYVQKMVARAHDFDPDYHIGVLRDKCLIKIGICNRIEMHDLIQDMGREIVRQQSPKNPGKRSRLWSNEDIRRVLERDEGTNEIIIIIQDKWSKSIEVDWNGEAFKKMKSLKILILENTKFSQGPKYLPGSLAVLRWRGYPSPSLPCGFRPKDLVEFDVGDSNFSSIQTISKIMPNVSVLNFGFCEYIRQIPNVSGLSSLKELWLPYCKNLIEIDNSVGQLPKLETLEVHDCAQLKTFPSEMNTPSLCVLVIHNCRNLKYFPEIVARDMKISDLYLSGTGINHLPRSIENLTRLEEICMERNNGRSMKLPSSISSLAKLDRIHIENYKELLMDVGSTICPYLRRLNLMGCNISDENLRIYLTSFSNVVSLDLTYSRFTILPACIEDCQKLVELVLDECHNLVQVEKIPPSIERLTAVDCKSLSSESRKLLLSKDLLASTVAINNQPCVHRGPWYEPHNAYFYVPGGSIPEWFDHYSKGPSISFWFRGYFFPSLCVCATLEQSELACQDYESWVKIKVFINDKMAHKEESRREVRLGYYEDKIFVHYIWDCNINKSFKEDQWTHAKICQNFDFENDTKESGIYVIRDEWTNMENIRFTDPLQSSDVLRGDQDGKLNETNMDASTEEDEPHNINSLDIPSRCHKKRNRNCLMKQHENNANSPNANHHDSINNQGCATEGDTATKKPFFPFQSEKQHTHSHAVLDFDSLKRLSAACRRLAFPISIHMNSGIVGSQLEYDFYITEQDVIEFLSMQELCITIIQLFVMFCYDLCFFRGIDDRFGFLCPNAVQGVGRKGEDRISYIGSTIKEGNKQCWLAPIHEGNHWTLCVICPESNIIYWFDSLGGEQSEDIKKVFTEALETYQIIRGRNIKWLRPNCCHQGGDNECGYYMVRYMYDIIDLNEVDSLGMHFNNPQCYSQEDINFIRNKWSAYLLEVHAPTSCRTRHEDRVKRLLFGRT